MKYVITTYIRFKHIKLCRAFKRKEQCSGFHVIVWIQQKKWQSIQQSNYTKAVSFFQYSR